MSARLYHLLFIGQPNPQVSIQDNHIGYGHSSRR